MSEKEIEKAIDELIETVKITTFQTDMGIAADMIYVRNAREHLLELIRKEVKHE